MWFPPIKCADVPLVKYTFLPFIHNGVEYNDCFDAEAVEANSITAAEINEGKVISSFKHFFVGDYMYNLMTIKQLISNLSNFRMDNGSKFAFSLQI